MGYVLVNLSFVKPTRNLASDLHQEQQEAISQKENSVSFPQKNEKGWGFDILCMKSPGVREICANAPLCAALIHSETGVFVQATCNTEPIVKEKGLINLSCLHRYQLLQSTYFEMQLGGTPLYRLYRYVQPQRVWVFKTFWSEIEYRFWSFVKLGMVFALALN